MFKSRVCRLILPCIAVVFCSFQSHGEGDILGNHGGLAELMLTKIWYNLSEELKMCLPDTNVCGFDEKQQTYLKKIVTTTAGVKPGEIIFRPDQESQRPLFVTEKIYPYSVVVSLKKLYGPDGKPLPLKNLMAVAVAIHLYQITELNYQDSIATAERMTQFWGTSVKTFKGYVEKKIYSLHVVKAHAKSRFANEVYIEYEKTSDDVSILFNEDLPCEVPAGGVDVSSAAFSQYSRDTINISGQVAFHCATGKTLQGSYQIEGQIQKIKTIYSVRFFDLREI